MKYDFLSVEDVNYDKFNVSFLDMKEVKTPKTQIQEVLMDIKQQEIIVDEPFQGVDVLSEFIDKVIEIYDIDDYPENLRDFKFNNNETVEENAERLTQRLNLCSNYIGINGRHGAATFVIVPYSYYKDINHYYFFSDKKIIPTYLLEDKIIIGRKNDYTYKPGIKMFYNKELDLYKIESIGLKNSKNQYHVLKITDINKLRKKKLEKICQNLKE